MSEECEHEWKIADVVHHDMSWMKDVLLVCLKCKKIKYEDIEK